MNTNDIRNLSSNQWLFWVVAIPLTAFVIIVSWILAGGELPAITWRPSWHQSRNPGPRVSFLEASQSPPAYQDVAADRDPYVSSRSRSKRVYDDYEMDLAGMGSRDRTGFNDDSFDPYARTESMTHRGRYSYASSAISTINSPRRVRRRKDPKTDLLQLLRSWLRNKSKGE